MTTRDGRVVHIDEEIAPLVVQMWRLGYRTKLACQDAGEAILHGGTRAPAEGRERQAARHAGRAWVIVAVDQGPALLMAVGSLPEARAWRLIRVRNDNDPSAWMSIMFPREDISPAAELLRGLSELRGPRM